MAIAWPAVAVAILTGWFSWLVTRQFVTKRRTNLFFWALSLLIACFASLAYALCILHPAAWLFLIYYLFGAMWMPSLMGLGSIALLASKRLLYSITAAVAVVGVIGSVGLLQTTIKPQALLQLDGGAGTGVVPNGWWLPFLIVLNSFGAAAVIIVALISACRTLRRNAPARFFVGNIWLAVGVLIASLAGGSARLGWPGLFWITMLIGWAVTFVGYTILTPRQAAAVSTPASQQVN